jgi:segregation and condensation protein B
MELQPGSLEALLFIYGEPIEVKKAAKMLGVSAQDIKKAADDLNKELSAENRGLALLQNDDCLQITTKAAFGGLLQTILKTELNEALSPAALETLSIITYAGPVSRAEVDYIRGVNSSFTVRALLLRGLIERDADPQRMNSYRYKPSVDLLHHLGVTRVEELPEFERFRTLVLTIKSPTQSSSGASQGSEPQVAS